MAAVAADGDQQAGADPSVAYPRGAGEVVPEDQADGSRAVASASVAPMPIVAAKLEGPVRGATSSSAIT